MPPQAGDRVQLELLSPQGNVSQQGEEQQAGDQSAKGKLIKSSSDLKRPGTTNVTLNFSQLGHQHKPKQPKWRLLPNGLAKAAEGSQCSSWP